MRNLSILKAYHHRAMKEAVSSYKVEIQRVEDEAAESETRMKQELYSRIGAIEIENDKLRLNLATTTA